MPLPVTENACVPNARLVRALAGAGLASIAAALLTMAAAPLLRPDIDHLGDGMSAYAVGPWAWVQGLGFVLLAAAAAATGGALALAGATLPGLLLLAASPFALGLAVFPMGSGGPSTPLGDLHMTCGTLAAVLEFAAMAALLLNPAAGGKGRWTALAVVALGSAAFVQLAVWRPELGIPEGLAMRLSAIPALLWWAVVAYRLRRFGAAPRPD